MRMKESEGKMGTLEAELYSPSGRAGRTGHHARWKRHHRHSVRAADLPWRTLPRQTYARQCHAGAQALDGSRAHSDPVEGRLTMGTVARGQIRMLAKVLSAGGFGFPAPCCSVVDKDVESDRRQLPRCHGTAGRRARLGFLSVHSISLEDVNGRRLVVAWQQGP